MILIRADANEKIGTGHVMRCLSIARAFRDMGEEVRFVTADRRADRLITGFDTVCLDSDWTRMETELDVLTDILRRTGPSLLLADSYFVTERYLHTLRSLVRTAYMDDLNKTRWDVDYLINYNLFSSVCDYSCYERTGTKLLLGPRYAPLREEFHALPPHEIRETVTDVLVSAGGADPEKITEQFINDLCPACPAVRFHFVLGALNPRIREIRKLEKDNVILHVREQHMAELMRSCDVAVSAAGTTLYELCAAGIPTITYALADNQLDAAEQFSVQNYMLSAGDCRKGNSIAARISDMLRRMGRAERKELSGRMQTLVDGCGAKRLAGELAGR